MSDILLDLPSHLRDRLASALESGLLSPSPTLASLGSVLGNRENAQDDSPRRWSNSDGLGSRGLPLPPGFGLLNGPQQELGNPTLCGPAPKSQACTLGIPDVSTKSCWALQSARSGRARTPFSTVLRRSRFWLDVWMTTPALRVTLLLEYPTQKGRHYRFRTIGAKVRGPFLEDRLARIVASKRVLRSAGA